MMMDGEARETHSVSLEYHDPQFASQPTYSPFSDEYLIPTQLLADPKRILCPEHRLLLAIVDQTKRDLHTHKHYATARSWFLSKSKAHPFTFSSICDALNVNPTELRREARRLRHPLSGRFARACDSPTIAA